MSGPQWPMIGKWALGVIVSLLGIMVADAKANVNRLENRVATVEQDLTAIKVNTAETRSLAQSAVSRLDRMDDKLDAILDRFRVPYNPGPRR